jgi:hypothetical protein
MPNSLTLSINPGQLSEGFCPNSYQGIWNGFAAVGSVTFPDTFFGIIISQTAPGVDDQNKAWIKVDGLGLPLASYPFVFASGAWYSRHPLPPGLTMIWTEALPDLNTFDGGSAGAVTTLTGPMWEEAIELRAKFPIGAGTLPSGAVLTVATDGGNETHTMTEEELFPHNHTFEDTVPATNLKQFNVTLADKEGTLDQGGSLDYKPAGDMSLTGGNTDGDPEPMNIMPPYRVVYFLKRTARIYIQG